MRGLTITARSRTIIGRLLSSPVPAFRSYARVDEAADNGPRLFRVGGRFAFSIAVPVEVRPPCGSSGHEAPCPPTGTLLLSPMASELSAVSSDGHSGRSLERFRTQGTELTRRVIRWTVEMPDSSGPVDARQHPTNTRCPFRPQASPRNGRARTLLPLAVDSRTSVSRVKGGRSAEE